MRFLLLVIGSFLLTCSISTAQSKWIPSSLRLGTEVLAYGYSLFEGKQIDRTQYEFNADIDIHNYFITLDYGVFDVNRSSSAGQMPYLHRNSGEYLRIGIDFDFIPSAKDRNTIYFGLRYGFSTWNSSMSYTVSNDFYGQKKFESPHQVFQANWYEMVLGFKAKVFKNVYMGYTLHYKFNKKLIGKVSEVTPYEIPGFGYNRSIDVWDLNYHIYYRIPFRAKPIPPKKKKG